MIWSLIIERRNTKRAALIIALFIAALIALVLTGCAPQSAPSYHDVFVSLLALIALVLVALVIASGKGK